MDQVIEICYSRPVTQKNIYLDYNATTPLHPEFLELIPSLALCWGNPSSIHYHGREPKRILREARQSLADYLKCQTTELIFTSSGSESNNLALKGVWTATRNTHPQKNKIIISSVEHPSILETANFMQEKWGANVVKVPVHPTGELDMDFFLRELDETVILVAIMFANNEFGSIFPIKKIAKTAKKIGAFVHCDAVQAIGKTMFFLDSLEVDSVSFAAHKFYGLKGSGVLYVKKATPLEVLIHGGSQERKRRAGTENVLATASLGFMAEKLKNDSYDKIAQMTRLRDHMEKRIEAEISDIKINCKESNRLANTSSIIIRGVDGESLLINLDIKGFSVSTGSACSSGSSEPSPTLRQIGLSYAEAQSTLRVSLGWFTTHHEIDAFVDQLKLTVTHLRETWGSINASL